MACDGDYANLIRTFHSEQEEGEEEEGLKDGIEQREHKSHLSLARGEGALSGGSHSNLDNVRSRSTLDMECEYIGSLANISSAGESEMEYEG